MCSLERNHILVKTYHIGGTSERIIPGRTLTEVTLGVLFGSKAVALLFHVCGTFVWSSLYVRVFWRKIYSKHVTDWLYFLLRMWIILTLGLYFRLILRQKTIFQVNSMPRLQHLKKVRDISPSCYSSLWTEFGLGHVKNAFFMRPGPILARFFPFSATLFRSLLCFVSLLERLEQACCRIEFKQLIWNVNFAMFNFFRILWGSLSVSNIPKSTSFIWVSCT